MITKYSALKKASEEASFAWFDILEEVKTRLVREALSWTPGKPRQQWKVIPANRLIKIWNDYITLGFVRDDKGVEEFKDLIIKNTAQLQTNTELMGHSDQDIYPQIQESLELSDEEIEKLRHIMENTAYAENEDGSWMLSDYGLPKLLDLVEQLLDAKTSEEKLVLIDQALNIVHQRNDLAAYFVEGGISTLNRLAGKPEND